MRKLNRRGRSWIVLAPLLMALGLSVITQPTLGHAFWVQPSSYVAKEDAVISFVLKMGEEFEGVEYARTPTHMKSFKLHSLESAESTPAAQGSSTGSTGIDVEGRIGRSPAGYIKLANEAASVVAYASEFSATTLSNKDFKAYVESEGLGKQIASTLFQDKSHIRERYARSAKALLVPEGHSGRPVDVATGLSLELVAEETSLMIEKHQAERVLNFRLFLEGSPLVGRSVFLERREAKGVVDAQESGTDGRVAFKIREPGTYLVRAINIVPAQIPGVDFNSQWTSITFAVTRQ